VLVFASLSEGFGLPILDAWATDTAIITGNKTSLPEIAGDAAFLVDPINISSIAEGLNALMNNGALRKQLCELGRVRLAGFTWHDAATRYINAIEKIVTR
jgi:alpha-1,3-rhamnosyl/mannosyltransferase